MADLEFHGRAVLITGAASGIGREAARRFAEQGAAVCVADIDIEGAERVAAEIRSAGRPAIAQALDVTDEEANERVFLASEEAFGRLDVAFLNAGVLGPA